MKYSVLFGKTIREAPRDEVSVNAKLLWRGGFVDKLMGGSYTLMPLGLRVIKKIEQIIREEINNTGAQEILMPLLHPKSIWNETGRWDSAKEVMYQFKKDEKEYALSFTHEEILLDLIRKHVNTYKDFPIKLYHFSTKFRNELRAKSGVLRGREFLMKDLYSVHTSSEDLDKYYSEVSDAYIRIFKKLGLDAIRVEAAGGVFTKDNTHEFQVICDAGEDEIIYCPGGDFAENTEISKVKEGKMCDLGHGPLKKVKAIEVGNIFRFGTVYSEKMNASFTDADGKKKFAYLGSYGIGLTRLMGTIVEIHHDEKGIKWPENVSPFDAHLIFLGSARKHADKVYSNLQKEGIEVLYDDRDDVAAGIKFADADLVGIPIRLVISDKSGEKVEFKKRDSDDIKLLWIEELIKKVKKEP